MIYLYYVKKEKLAFYKVFDFIIFFIKINNNKKNNK